LCHNPAQSSQFDVFDAPARAGPEFGLALPDRLVSADVVTGPILYDKFEAACRPSQS
jgi:hypothetical protein